VRSFGKINSKVSSALENQYILHHPNRTKSAKLAMSLIMTMAHVYKSKILHNDISPSNILLHFPPDHIDRIYIGVCDWGMASRVIEEKPLVYGYSTKEEMERNKKEQFGWPQSYFMFMAYAILRHHWSMYRGGICIQRKRMHTRLGRWHYIFGMTNVTHTYSRQQKRRASSFQTNRTYKR
jgi:serine/threonine protein kinase